MKPPASQSSRPGEFSAEIFSPGAPSARPRDNQKSSWWDVAIARVLFAVACVGAGYHFHPFGLSKPVAAGVWMVFAVAVMLLEVRLRHASLRRLIGAAFGSILGLLGAYLSTLVLSHTTIPESERSFLGLAIFVVLLYIGLVLGANKGDVLNLQALGGLISSEANTQRTLKVLDTSVIIDGRIADIAEAHFIEGTLAIPQFVLRELQLVADSADPLKRQRGRRGLEVLQRIRKIPNLEIHIAEDNFPHIADVDMKLIEMAKRYNAQIVTNDFNLNKVATLQGIEILNVNQLANALKPVVLPGEVMRVFILREGKEYNQGVAYLDDGTMVVVDGARKLINKTVDITVTSVHQTTAGKMIFGRFDERTAAPAPAAEPASIPPPGEPRAAEPAPPSRSPRPVSPTGRE